MATARRTMREQPAQAAVVVILLVPVMYVAASLLAGSLPFVASAVLVALVSAPCSFPQALTDAVEGSGNPLQQGRHTREAPPHTEHKPRSTPAHIHGVDACRSPCVQAGVFFAGKRQAADGPVNVQSVSSKQSSAANAASDAKSSGVAQPPAIEAVRASVSEADQQTDRKAHSEPASASMASRAALAAAAPAAASAVAIEEEQPDAVSADAQPLARDTMAPQPVGMVQQPDSKPSAAEEAPTANGYHLPNGDGPHTANAGSPPEVTADDALRPRTVEVPGYKPWVDPLKKSDTFAELDALFQSRIAFIDGAMGTSIQRYNLEEEDYRGERYAKHHKELRGNNDLLVITKPEARRCCPSVMRACLHGLK